MSNISLRDGDTVTAAGRGREFWHGVLLAGGFTAVPRWTLRPVAGAAEHEAGICNDVVAALHRRPRDLGGALHAVSLTGPTQRRAPRARECARSAPPRPLVALV